MKNIFHTLLAWYLATLARVALRRNSPIIIAVAGTVNKAFTVAAIASKLRTQGLSVESTPHNFNTDIGLPLAILGLPSGYNSYKAWLAIIPGAFGALKRPFPEVLVLEMGINRPGDMRALLRVICPQIAVITEVTQRYRENFGGLDKIAVEYAELAATVPADGLLVLNYDTMLVRELKQRTKACVQYVSLTENATDITSATVTPSLEGYSGVITHNGVIETISIPRFGRHHIFAYLYADVVAKYFLK